MDSTQPANEGHAPASDAAATGSDAPTARGVAAGDVARMLEAQRAAFLEELPVPLQRRIDRLDRLIALLVGHRSQLCEAVAGDFGRRPAALTGILDVFPAVHALKFARRHVRRWMRPRRCRVELPLGLPGVRAEIACQPLGVVGVLSPWNFPISLSLGPLAGILAAGNRCLIKPSEITPRTSELIKRLVALQFDPRELAVITGGPDVAAAFSRLPFDHLLFTGSTEIGRRVMAAAAGHLVPVTLELGGKCPVVVSRSADLPRAVDRILLGKLANAGQVCLAPDHVYVPAESIDAFVREARTWVSRAYPALDGNADYTSLVSDAHAARAAGLLDEALAQGARVIALAAEEAGPQGRPTSAAHVMSPTVVVGATDRMRLMREEIFAPILPLVPYDDLDGVMNAILRRGRPLALYYFGRDPGEERKILSGTISGGVVVNDVGSHFLAETLPFGGVGPSGIGAYHGEHGFRRFSHERAVLRQTRIDVAGLIGARPPYGRRLERSLRWLVRA